MMTADPPQGMDGSGTPAASWLPSWAACLADPVPQYVLVGVVLLLIIALQVRLQGALCTCEMQTY